MSFFFHGDFLVLFSDIAVFRALMMVYNNEVSNNNGIGLPRLIHRFRTLLY